MSIQEGRVEKTAHNMITGFLYQFVTLVLGFVSRTVFIWALGTEYLGLNSIFSDVLTLLSMADLGFGTAMAYSFYKPLAEKDTRKLAALVNFYKKIYNIIAVSVSVVGIAIIPFLRMIVRTEQDIPLLEVYYLFALANIVISYLFVYRTTILTADQRDYEVVRVRLWITILKTVLQIALLYLTKNYIIFLAINVISQFMINYIASRKADKMYPYINEKEYITKEEEKDIMANMKSVFLYKVSGTMFNATDNLLISVLVGTAMVGIYSNYLMISSKLLLVIQIMFSALTASVGNLVVVETAKKRLDIFNAMQSVSFILCGIITTVFYVLANDLVYVWLGQEFVLAKSTIVAITLNTYLSCVLQPLWSYREATGLYQKTKYVMLIAAIMNIVLSIILGKCFGLTGILFASAISRLSTYFWYEPKLLFREYFNSSAIRYYFSFALNMLLVVVAGVGLSIGLSSYVVTGWNSLIIKGIMVGSICSVIFMAMYCKSKGVKVILDKVREIINRKRY